jgi:hypothetical protein
MRYRGDNRIQAYSTKNRPVLGLGLSFGEPQRPISSKVDSLESDYCGLFRQLWER